MLRLSLKSKLPSLALGRAKPVLPAGRLLSTLGNPMFPQRPLPELETFEESIENSKKAKQANGGDPEKKGFVDILADHGGKIALVVFGGVIALFYTYYASGKDRNKLEDGISEAALIEPYEIQELRYTNKLSKDDFVSIAKQCRTHFHSGQATYAEFVLFLRDKVVLPALPVDPSSSSSNLNSFNSYGASNKTPSAPQPAAVRRVQLNSTHLLDRVIMGHIQRKFSPSTPAGTAEASSSPASTSIAFAQAGSGAQSGVTESLVNGVPAKTVSWTSTPLDVDLLLVVLNLAMVPQAEDRVQALYDLAQLYPETGGSDHAYSHVSGGASSEGGDVNAENASGDTLSQDTVPRGELLFCVIFVSMFVDFLCGINCRAVQS